VIYAPLDSAGQYVLFPATTFHRGYYNNQEETVYTAQFFAGFKANKKYSSRTKWKKCPLFYQVQSISPNKLCALKEDLFASWDDHYPSATYPPPENYKNEKIDTMSNRYVQKEHFSHPQLGHVRELVAIFEELYPLEIQSVWFIKKSRGGDGFQRWHQDLVGVGTVAATIVLNIDSLGQEEEENDLSARHIKSSHQKIMAIIQAKGMSVKKMYGDGNCLFRSLSDQLFEDNGKGHNIVRSVVCNYLSDNIDSLREFFPDEIDIHKYINKMRKNGVWGGNKEIAAAAMYYSRKITIFQDGLTTKDSSYSIGDNLSKPPLMLVYTGHKHYDSVISSSAGNDGNGSSASGTGGSVAMNTRYQARKAKLAWENKESTGRVVNDSQLEGDDSPPTGMTWPQQSVKQSASEDSPTEEKGQPEDAGNKRAAVLSTAATIGFPGKFVGFYPPSHPPKIDEEDNDSEYSYEESDSDYSDSYLEGQE